MKFIIAGLFMLVFGGLAGLAVSGCGPGVEQETVQRTTTVKDTVNTVTEKPKPPPPPPTKTVTEKVVPPPPEGATLPPGVLEVGNSRTIYLIIPKFERSIGLLCDGKYDSDPSDDYGDKDKKNYVKEIASAGPYLTVTCAGGVDDDRWKNRSVGQWQAGKP